MKRSIHMLEALGLTLLLLAWGLNWTDSFRSDGARARWSSLRRDQGQAAAEGSTRYVLTVATAVGASSVARGSTQASELGIFREWNTPDVRRAWIDWQEAAMGILQQLLDGAYLVDRELSLEYGQTIQANRDSLKATMELYADLNLPLPSGTSGLILGVDATRPERAAAVMTAIRLRVSAVAAMSAEIDARIKAQAQRAYTRYMILFLGGSVAMIGSKLVAFRSAGENTPADAGAAQS